MEKKHGISQGKYYDPENDHYFTNKHVKSPTQMERDAVCRGQYHGWLKEKVGSHIIRRCHIHHCEQTGIVGRMGCVFSIIERHRERGSASAFFMTTMHLQKIFLWLREL